MTHIRNKTAMRVTSMGEARAGGGGGYCCVFAGMSRTTAVKAAKGKYDKLLSTSERDSSSESFG